VSIKKKRLLAIGLTSLVCGVATAGVGYKTRYSPVMVALSTAVFSFYASMLISTVVVWREIE
jgi:hypothetical protein